MSTPDPSLQVVARVRGVRERDSRIGLVEALAEVRSAADRVAALEQRLAAVPPHTLGDVAAFTARQHALAALGEALVAARGTHGSASVLAVAARETWSADRTRLAAVESLLERRAEARRVEQRRREDRRMDEVATELWRRHPDRTDPGPAAGEETTA